VSAEQAPLSAALGVADAAPGEWHSKVTHESITIEAAKQAVACTALGCTRGEQLLLTQIRDFGERVLCPHHALELIEREIGDHQEER